MRPARSIAATAFLAAFALGAAGGAESNPPINLSTSAGPLEITPVGHASLMIRFAGQVIHVDPYSKVADYTALPDADQVWITHDHPDHLDKAALDAVLTANTRIVADQKSGANAILKDRSNVTVLKNGENASLPGGIRLEAIPSYNVVQERAPGQKYHPRGDYNAYVATFGDKRVLIAGDTECTPALGKLENIDVAFLPINLPFTMTPEEAAACAKVINPKILVPYHQGDADPNRVAELLKNSGIDVRVLKLP